jgi:hypothetical protein
VSRATKAFWASLGFTAGAVAGFFWWSQEQETNQRSLFSPKPMKRLAALGWISGQPGAESAVLLREYLTWEQNPLLRRRARRLLTRFENALS